MMFLVSVQRNAAESDRERELVSGSAYPDEDTQLEIQHSVDGGSRDRGSGQAWLPILLCLDLLAVSLPPSLCAPSAHVGKGTQPALQMLPPGSPACWGGGWEGWMSCCHGNNDLTRIAWFLLCGLSNLQCSHASQTGESPDP